MHKFRTGLSFLYDRYDEDYKVQEYLRVETVPGVFAEYTFTPNDKFSAVAGLRADHNSLSGFFVTPRLNLQYEPVKGTTIRASVGRGQRTANICREQQRIRKFKAGHCYGYGGGKWIRVRSRSGMEQRTVVIRNSDCLGMMRYWPLIFSAMILPTRWWWIWKM